MNTEYSKGIRCLFFRSALLAFCLFLPGTTLAEIGAYWPPIQRYETMSCPQLGVELAYIRKDLQALQDPSNLGNPRWNEANSRFRILISIYEERCRRLTLEERTVPGPVAKPLLPEAELVAAAKRALKAGRFVDAQRILTEGAKAGYPSAQYDLGMLKIVAGEKDTGLYWLDKAAKQGHRKAAEALRSMGHTP